MKENSNTTFFLAEFFINIARGIITLALGMYFYYESDGIWIFAMNILAEFIVILIIQGSIGSVIDKFGPKNSLLFATACSSFIVFISSFFVDINIIVLLTLMMQLINLFKPLIRNSIFTFTSQLAHTESVEKINARLSIALQSGQIIGMIVAGFMVGYGDLALTLQVISLTFLLSFISFVAFFSKKKVLTKDKKDQRKVGSWHEAVNFVLKSKKVQLILIVGSFDFTSIVLFNIFLAPVVKYNFNNQTIWLTYLDLSFALGAIIAGMLIGRKEFFQKKYYTSISSCSAVIVFFCFTLALPPFITLITILGFGLSTTYSTVYWATQLQQLAPVNIKGRLASIKFVVTSFFISIASLIASFAHSYHFQLAILSGGIIAAILSLLAFYLGRMYKKNFS